MGDLPLPCLITEGYPSSDVEMKIGVDRRMNQTQMHQPSFPEGDPPEKIDGEYHHK